MKTMTESCPWDVARKDYTLAINRLVGTLGWRPAFDGSKLPTRRLGDNAPVHIYE